MMTGSQPKLTAIAPSPRHDAGEAIAKCRPLPGGGPLLRPGQCLHARIGTLLLEMRDFGTQYRHTIDGNTQVATLILPLAGETTVTNSGVRSGLTRTDMLWWTQQGSATLAWAAGGRSLIVQVPRQQLQVSASRLFGDARRLGMVERVVGGAARLRVNGLFDTILPDIDWSRGVGPDSAETRFIETLVATLAASGMADDIFPRVRSITRAMHAVSENYEQNWDAEAIARAAGVTVPTLRRGFRSCLGLSIGDYVQEARLQRAFRSMASGTDSRQIAAVAASIGYRTPSAFTRAYHKRFGEAPSETRRRAVGMNMEALSVK
ncbi:MAG: AraC family transcriptional regulator [Sphingobium sp.]|uniref:AraC family transcriptional regulator n=1 Tax=Sphingobium sp. CECT 9361 TaxID=2845384 RepID=UPI001E60C703|nr:AraC family transcriptional regulator [Sphingobium sp. CECT 9361]CAH0348280.1 hypothetical protein SPH9361_00020 [Sphingobium sp. CECT 9361]